MQRCERHHYEAGGDQHRAADGDKVVHAKAPRQPIGQEAADKKANRRQRSIVAVILRSYAESNDQHRRSTGGKNMRSRMGPGRRKCVRRETPGFDQTAIAGQHCYSEQGRGFGSSRLLPVG